jgi:phage terminase small subunit
MARPPKTTAQHKRDGTFRADRHGDRLDADEFGGSLPHECPAHLTNSYAREIWELVIQSSPPDVLQAIDETHLAGCCWWGGEFHRIADELDNTEPTEPAYYRLQCSAAMAWKHYAAASSRFGMTPIDRARLKVSPKAEESADPLSTLSMIGAKRGA